MRALDVICAGAAIVDILLQPVSKNIFDTESYPLDSIAMTIGGDAINEAVILSRLGHKTALMSMVGVDPAGAFVRDTCHKNGIDDRSLRTDPQVTTSINVGLVTQDGERTFVTNRRGSLWRMTAADIDVSRFSEARLLSFASIFNEPLLDGRSLRKIFQAAKAVGLTVCADMIRPRFNETLEDIAMALDYVDYFFPNYDEAVLLTGKTAPEEIADAFLSCGVKNIIVKLGKQGCYIKNQQFAETVPAVQGIHAVDTTGAGDNFAAGFISGLLQGSSLMDCGRLANATAAVSVQSVGATTGVQSCRQVEQLYRCYLQQTQAEV